MNIGITGHSGFIGQALSTTFEQAGHNVIGYSRTPKDNQRKYYPLEKGKTDWTGLDAIIHLAGENVFGRWTANKKKRILDSRTIPTQNLVADLKSLEPHNRPKTLLCASGVGFYGNTSDQKIDESHPVGDSFLSQVSQKWEDASAQASELGLRVIHARFGMVLGQSGGAWPLLKKIFSLGLGGPLGNGRQWMSWISIQDLTSLTLICLETTSAEGPINFVSPTPLTNMGFTKEIGKHLKRPTIIPAPAFGLKLVYGDMSQMLLHSQRVFPAKAETLGYQWEHPTLASFLETSS